MAINSAAAAVTVTSAAKNGTLLGQTGASDEIVFDTAISTNNGDLVASPTFAGRTIILRRDDATEETKFIAEEFGDALTCRVNEDWTVGPTSGDSYDVAYIAVDANTVGARFGVLLKRISDWSLSAPFIIGSGGGTFAYFALLEGYSIESDNGLSAGQRAFLVEDGARWDIGYISSDAPVSSGFLVSTADTEGDTSLEVLDNGKINFLDTLMSCVNNTVTLLNGVTVWNKGKIFSGSTGMNFVSGVTGSVTVTELTIEGRASPGETITIDENFVSNSVNIVSTNGFVSGTTAIDGELEVRNPLFVGNLRNIFVEQDQTWNMVNPNWTVDEGTTGTFDYTTGSATGAVNEKFSLDITTASPTGGVLAGSTTYVYESVPGPTLPADNRQTTSAGGTASSDILKRDYTKLSAAGLTGTIHNDFALKVYNYTRLPFVTAITPDEALAFQVTLIDDDAISETNANTIIVGTSGISLDRSQANPHSLIEYSGGTGALNVGDSIVAGGTGASGVIVEIVTGDAIAGKVFLDTRNGSAFNSGPTSLLGFGGGWTGAFVAASDQRFTWHINATGESVQDTYDYLAARLAQDPVTDDFVTVIEWGEDEHGLIFQNTPAGFLTERNINLSEGIFISNRGAGNVASMEDDSGVDFVPPTTISLTVQGVVEGARCLIEANGAPAGAGVALMSKEANAAGIASVSFQFSGSQDVIVKARLRGFLPFETTGTIENADFTVTAVWIEDTIVD